MRYLTTRSIGRLEVSAIGLGCMGMSEAYGPSSADEAFATITAAVERGVTMIDTADVYGDGANEELVGCALKGRRSEVRIATKFAFSRGADGSFAINGRPDNARRCCDASLRRLGTDYIDLYYLHRVDPLVPIEDTVGAMADLVAAGKVRFLGLSEASARSVRRAASTHEITAVQSEWSLWTRNLEDDVVPAARALGIGIVAFSPLGRGFLTGTLRDIDGLASDDMRRGQPRLRPENFDVNLELVDRLRAVAQTRGCSIAQLVLAWLLAQGSDIIPLIGTTKRAHLEENVGAVDVVLSESDLAEIERALPVTAVRGDRYDSWSYGDTPERVVEADPAGVDAPAD